MELLPSSRRKLLRDRERNLCKKADELSILCGTDVCIIIFKPQKTKPETWPQDCTQVHRIIKKYKAKLAIQNYDIKGTRNLSSLGAIRDAADASTAHSSCSHETNTKIQLDLNLSDFYDSETKGKKLYADYDTINSKEAREMEMQSNKESKLPKDELIGDDEATLASLEAKLLAITKRIALREATYV